MSSIARLNNKGGLDFNDAPQPNQSKEDSTLDELSNTLWALQHNEIGYHEAKTRLTQQIKNYCQEQVRLARIDELQHIDDPPNVRLYFEGLISVEDRIKELRAGNAETNN